MRDERVRPWERIATLNVQPESALPGIAQHVVQRGNDRQPCFFPAADYPRYRHDLREIAMAEDCAIHAYVLMTNPVHVLLTPTESGSVARVMQSLGRRQLTRHRQMLRRLRVW